MGGGARESVTATVAQPKTLAAPEYGDIHMSSDEMTPVVSLCINITIVTALCFAQARFSRRPRIFQPLWKLRPWAPWSIVHLPDI